MDFTNPSYLVLIVSLVVGLGGILVRVAMLLGHSAPKDPSPPRVSPFKSIVYAYTIGMLPWKKESARLHKLVYLRGVLLHLGVFTSIVLLWLSLFVDAKSLYGSVAFSPLLGLGFLAGLAAVIVRIADKNLRALNRPDDFISLILVTLIILSAFGYVLSITSREVFWGAASAVLLYLPWSKIPHVAYFFFAKNVFGIYFGRRGVMPAPKKSI
ncbi:MAG: hypothetical protein PHG35_03985 [Dehalococcoidales bacterium]|nr:hypothetical protein [Dehalococcoidales bacterium]